MYSPSLLLWIWIFLDAGNVNLWLQHQLFSCTTRLRNSSCLYITTCLLYQTLSNAGIQTNFLPGAPLQCSSPITHILFSAEFLEGLFHYTVVRVDPHCSSLSKQHFRELIFRFHIIIVTEHQLQTGSSSRTNVQPRFSLTPASPFPSIPT